MQILTSVFNEIDTAEAQTTGATTAVQDTTESTNARIYKAIRDLITSYQLKPGVKLIHQELADKLGVSRTPVREALERLDQEGLVIRIPRRGFYVAEVGEEEARELYELREALELYALRKSMERGISPDSLAKLDAFGQKYKTLLRDDTLRERMIVDMDFHLQLAGFAGNSALVQALRGVFERLILRIRTEGYRLESGAEALREHIVLINALRSGNRRKSEDLLTAHIHGARRRLSQRARPDIV